MIKQALAVALATAVLSAPVVGQERIERFPGQRIDQPGLPTLLHPDHPPGIPALIGSGALGLAAGVALGGLVGWGVERAAGSCGEYACGATGVFWGGLAGLTTGIPTAIHLANQRQGSYGYGLLTSAGLMVGGYTLAAMTSSVSASAFPIILLAIPVVQIGTGVFVEKQTEISSGSDRHGS